MKMFYCDSCGSLVFFENTQCIKCEHTLGFLPEVLDLSALEPAGDNWRALADPAKGRVYRQCQNNRDYKVCNWYVPTEDPEPLCLACRMNETIPDLNIAVNLERWYRLEIAKRRLVYTLQRLELPLDGGGKRPPLQFNFLAAVPGGPAVLSGHKNGLITLNISEADDAEREKRRTNLHEPYRTLLGHFRHESAHYYWDLLIANTPHLAKFREVFGDESQDYAAALKAHYNQGAPADWQTRFVTTYASSHPWEDWAETWAHYLHIVDMVETAAGFGISLAPRHPDARAMTADPKKAAHPDATFDGILRHWFPLTYALNSLNRGMGLPDLYPFALSDPVVEKLRFIHETIHDARRKV
jgi:hypothetical protein